MHKQTKLLLLSTFILLNFSQNLKPDGFNLNFFGLDTNTNPMNTANVIEERVRDVIGKIKTTQARTERQKQERIREVREKKQRLFNENRRDPIPEIEIKARLKTLQREEEKLSAEISKGQENTQEWVADARNLLFHALQEGLSYAAGEANQARKEREAILTAAAKARAKEKEVNAGKMERQKEFFKPENLQKMALFLTVVTAGATGAYYGGKLGFNYLDSKIGTKPTLIRESSRHDWKYSFKKYWKENILGIAPEEISLDEVILPQDMALKMQTLADDTKSCVENGLPFRNILFYGPPGTGKTMFAKRLAKYSDMDYAIMSGADFAQFQGGEGISELHKVFDWAKNSKKGLMIFIDEADSALGDRKTLDDIGRKIVNAFLSQTGESSFKFMIVLATNYDDDLDSAVLSRTHKKVCFDLPAFVERLKIFNLYFDKYIVNDVRKIKKNGTHLELSIEISPEINSEYIENIATKIDGFSGREIEQMVSELRVAAYNIGNGILSKDIIDDVVDEKIKEHKHDVETIEKQRKLFNAKFNKEIEIPTAA